MKAYIKGTNTRLVIRDFKLITNGKVPCIICDCVTDGIDCIVPVLAADIEIREV